MQLLATSANLTPRLIRVLGHCYLTFLSGTNPTLSSGTGPPETCQPAIISHDFCFGRLLLSQATVGLVYILIYLVYFTVPPNPFFKCVQTPFH